MRPLSLSTPQVLRERGRDGHDEGLFPSPYHTSTFSTHVPSTHKPLRQWLCPAIPQMAAPPRPYQDGRATSRNLRTDSLSDSLSLSGHWSRHQSQAYLVGSSKNMTGGLLTNSSAMARRFRWPPDRLPVRVLAQGSKPSAVRISLTCGQQKAESLLGDNLPAS